MEQFLPHCYRCAASANDKHPSIQAPEQLEREFRSALHYRGITGWQIAVGWFNTDLDLVIEQTDAVGREVEWEPMVPGGSESPATIHSGRRIDELSVHGSGFLRLPGVDAAAARWTAFDPQNAAISQLELVAFRSADDLRKFAVRIREIRNRISQGVWLDSSDRRDHAIPRDSSLTWDGLVLSKDLKHRLEADVAGFFSPGVRQLYADIQTPYRRGVLLHGPPGNGKTSIIRVLGALLPTVSGIILRTHSQLENDDLCSIGAAWKRHAPAMLIIEDLDTLFESSRVTVSAFLNMLDGLTDVPDDGLMIIGTTNHPERLDPAINSRPGRFDVLLSIPNPSKALRCEMLSRLLPKDNKDTVDEFARMSDGFSFAHLREAVSLAGLRAIHAGRKRRNEADLVEALSSIRETINSAKNGFSSNANRDFGFARQAD